MRKKIDVTSEYTFRPCHADFETRISSNIKIIIRHPAVAKWIFVFAKHELTADAYIRKKSQ